MTHTVLIVAAALAVPAAAAAQAVTDAPIASIVVTANQVDIDAGQLAARRASKLKALLVKVRSAFVAHLEPARQVQKRLGAHP